MLVQLKEAIPVLWTFLLLDLGQRGNERKVTLMYFYLVKLAEVLKVIVAIIEEEEDSDEVNPFMLEVEAVTVDAEEVVEGKEEEQQQEEEEP